MEKNFKLELTKILDKYGCELIDFHYYKKVFGNIVLKIVLKDKELNFVTDRGEIYCNGELLCNYDYLKNENKTTSQKLIELMDLKLKLIQKQL